MIFLLDAEDLPETIRYYLSNKLAAINIKLGMFFLRSLIYLWSTSTVRDTVIALRSVLPSGQQGPHQTLPFDPFVLVPKQSKTPSIPLASKATPSDKPIGEGNSSPLFVQTTRQASSSLYFYAGSKFALLARKKFECIMS